MKNELIDTLYGSIPFNSHIRGLLECPELLRLKEVRMSNINFINFPGFSESSRYEHSIGTGYLALRLSKKWGLPQKDSYELVIAALFHDVATPAFGHVMESVYAKKFGFDHEEVTAWIILGKTSNFMKTPKEPIFAGEGPRLRYTLRTLPEKVDIGNIFDYVSGKGKFGRMIKGSVDLDNIDNVVRSALHIGLLVDKTLPIKLVESFDIDNNGSISFRYENSYLIQEWLRVRRDLYTHLLLNTYDLNRECMLRYAIEQAVRFGILKEWHWRMTDVELINYLSRSSVIETEHKKESEEISRVINQVRLCRRFRELGLYWIDDPDFNQTFRDNPALRETIENGLSTLFKARIVVYIVPDKTSRAVDNFILTPLGPLLGHARIADIGHSPTSLLVCIYSSQPTLVKRDQEGRPILAEDHSQQKYTTGEVREIVLTYLRERVGCPEHVKLFDSTLLMANTGET